MNDYIIDLVDYVEDKDIEINPNYFYHGTPYSMYGIEKIKNMLEHGIKCPILTGKLGGPYNGAFHISISSYKKGHKSENTAYNNYLEKYLMFVLSDKLKAIETKASYPVLNSLIGGFCLNTPIPFRTSCFYDEFQVLGRINPKYFEGLEYYIKGMLERRKNNLSGSIDLFNNLYSLVSLLDSLNMDLPIYDYSTNKEINKEKVLKLELIK